jgi:predicted RNase H-like HicB family nuclease
MAGGGPVTKKRYTARCEWDETGWWVVTIPELSGAVTQSRRLDQVRGDVAEVVRLLTGEPLGDYELDVEAHFPGPAGEEAARAAALRTESDRLSLEAKDAAADAVAALRAAGLTYRDIGALVGVSHQRAQQLSEERSGRSSSRQRVGK